MIDQPVESRHLTGTAATLTVQLRNEDGEPAAAVGTVTVQVVRLDGTTLKAAGTATTGTGTTRSVVLTPVETGASLDRLTAIWTDNGVVVASTVHEIVGGFWFGLAELSAMEGVDRAVSAPPGGDPTAVLRRARMEIEDLFEWATGVAWVKRVTREYLTGCGRSELIVRMEPRELLALSVDGTAQTVADWHFESYGVLRRDGGGSISSEPRGVDVRYTHGFDRPTPKLRAAALEAARHALVSDRTSPISPRATSMSIDGNQILFGRVDRDNPTGIPTVDGIVRSHTFRVPGVG